MHAIPDTLDLKQHVPVIALLLPIFLTEKQQRCSAQTNKAI